jgi:FkbM family methyltransferase
MNSILQAIRRYFTYLAWLAGSRYSRANGWFITRGKARIALENVDDFLTTYDVYASGHYNRLELAVLPGSVVWDIGANIGVASLIFAQNSNVSHIYAYEPMPHTFACAMRSLRANPALSAKITLENLGVGSCEGDLQVSYTRKAKAAIGVSEIPPRLKMLYRIKPEDMETITIRLADAAQVLQSIRARHPGAPILLKLDAEGAEYGIIDRLAETGAIQELAAAAIEWHLKPGEEYLTSKLRAAGFQTQAKVLEPGSIGMIDAWKLQH